LQIRNFSPRRPAAGNQHEDLAVSRLTCAYLRAHMTLRRLDPATWALGLAHRRAPVNSGDRKPGKAWRGTFQPKRFFSPSDRAPAYRQH